MVVHGKLRYANTEKQPYRHIFATRGLPFRLKDKHAKLLREVNFVWNYCAEMSLKVCRHEWHFLSGYAFHR